MAKKNSGDKRVATRKAAVAKAGKRANPRKVIVEKPVVAVVTGAKVICVTCKAKGDACVTCVVGDLSKVLCKDCKHRRVDSSCCKNGGFVAKKSTCDAGEKRA